MTRVFHLIKSLGRGGAELLLSEGRRFSDPARFSYAYGYFLPWKHAVADLLRAEGASVTCFERRHALSILGASRDVAHELARFRADVLHCHLPVAGIVGRFAGRMAGVPVVYTEHNRLERYHPLTRWATTRTYSLHRRTIAVSADVAESIRAHVRRPRNKAELVVDVIPNGIDVSAFSPEAVGAEGLRATLGIPAEAPIVGTVAVFRRQKALDDWLDAARIVHERIPDARFVLVGDGPLRSELETRVDALGLRDAVRFPGLQSDVRPWLRIMDVYQMSSRFEGLPLALLEAMAMELPVVSTAVGGIPEVVVHGRNGLLVRQGRPQELAESTLSALADPALRRALGRGARSTVRERFSMERMSDRLEALYEEVVVDARRRAA